VTGVATAVHRGRTLATYEVLLTDEDGRRLCTSRITCLIRRREG
jgi:1,4-dihydroxy-2-naphthoyl-CoA hydrolase